MQKKQNRLQGGRRDFRRHDGFLKCHKIPKTIAVGKVREKGSTCCSEAFLNDGEKTDEQKIGVMPKASGCGGELALCFGERPRPNTVVADHSSCLVHVSTRLSAPKTHTETQTTLPALSQVNYSPHRPVRGLLLLGNFCFKCYLHAGKIES